jgi:type 1 fimbria pilin
MMSWLRNFAQACSLRACASLERPAGKNIRSALSRRIFRRNAQMRVATRLAGILALFACAYAWAGTVTFPNNGASTLVLAAWGPASVPRDKVVGNTISSSSKNPGIGFSGVTCSVTKTVTVNGTLVAGSSNIYQTNLNGVGVQFAVSHAEAGAYENVPVTETFSVSTGTGNGGSTQYVKATLIVTGPVQSGVLTSLPSVTVAFSGSCFTTVTQTFTITPGTAITALTCTVFPPPSVNLPSVKTGSLHTVGNTAGDTPFSIGLSCQPGSNINVTFTDATNPSNRSSNLSLATGSTAQGVALQVLYSGSPLHYGADSGVAGNQNQFYVGPSASTTSIPLTARYVSVGAVTPGMVLGLATFTMSYQ